MSPLGRRRQIEANLSVLIRRMDTQKQQQGQPTAAQQAQGAKPQTQAVDQGC